MCHQKNKAKQYVSIAIPVTECNIGEGLRKVLRLFPSTVMDQIDWAFVAMWWVKDSPVCFENLQHKSNDKSLFSFFDLVCHVVFTEGAKRVMKRSLPWPRRAKGHENRGRFHWSRMSSVACLPWRNLVFD
jgi:hypothetical protein